MCGLAGVLHAPAVTGAPELAARVASMAGALDHRGPDDHGTWVDAEAGIGLGHRRLAVVDLSPTGHQPMVSASGRYVLAYNGELYNHRALAATASGAGHRFQGTSDTEVLLAAIERWGLRAALERANAMFALALWDRRERRLSLARDRLGEKPLYWTHQGGLVAFGSELAALRSHPGVRLAIDRDALALYFRHKYVPAPHSIYRDVAKLEAGAIVHFDTRGRPIEVCHERYWSVLDHLPARPSGPPGPLGAGGSPVAPMSAGGPSGGIQRERAVDELGVLLGDAVALRMHADVPVGAFLSGGVDSTAVVALMQAASATPVRTFTIGSDDDRFDERAPAAAVARHLGTEHTELVVTAEQARAAVPRMAEVYDEPFADSSQIPTLLVSELARRDVTVALSGDGGDELFGGYNRYRWVPAIWRRAGRVPTPVRRGAASLLGRVPAPWWDRAARALPSRRRPRLLGTKMGKVADIAGCDSPEAMYLRLVSHWPEPHRLVLGSVEPATLASQPETWPAGSLTDRMRAVDTATYLPDDILTKLDRASMAVGLEARVPLLDHRVVEHAMRLEADLLWRDGAGKWILRQVANRHVPAHLVERPKTGFGVPVGEWLRGPLRPWAAELLARRRLVDQGLLAADQVDRVWREHTEGRRDHTYRLWDIVMFQAWMQRWS
jgi:asparagine synthase (glutamine-hydrolysing)